MASEQKETDTASVGSVDNIAGIKRVPPETIHVKFFGRIRYWKRITPWEWVFFVFGCLNALISIGLTGERLAGQIDPQTSAFTFSLLLLINSVFCLGYLITGIFTEDSYQISVFFLGEIIVLVYVGVDFNMMPEGPWRLARLICSAVFTIITLILGLRYIKIYHQCKFVVFGITDGNEALARVCYIFFFCGTVLALDLQFELSILILGLKYGTESPTNQKIIMSVGIVISVAIATIGYITLRRENKVLMWFLWIFTFWANFAYVIYKFIKTPIDMAKTNLLFYITFIAGSLALLIRLILIAATITAYRNFGKGYKQARFGTRCRFQDNHPQDI